LAHILGEIQDCNIS